MSYRIAAASIASLALLLGCTQAPVRTITVQGTGTVSVVPDIIEMSVNVSFTERTLNEALLKTKDTVSKVGEVTRKHQIADQDVQTSSVQSNKEYDYDRESNPIFRGYSSSQTTGITIHDTEIFERFTGDLMGLGISGITNVTYSHSRLAELSNEANLKALSDADSSADEMLGHMGLRKGMVIVINNTAEEPQFYSFGYSGETRNKALTSGGVSVSTGIMEIARHVVVTYQIQ